MKNNQPRRARMVGLKPTLLKALAFTISALTYQHVYASECSAATFKIEEFMVCLPSVDWHPNRSTHLRRIGST